MPGADRPGGRSDEEWTQLVQAVRDDLAECVEKTIEDTRAMHSYDDVGVPVIRELVRRSYEAALDGLQQRRGPGAQDDGMIFETAGERRARQGGVLREMLVLWRVGLQNPSELARKLAASSPGRDPFLLEFLELALAWDDFAMGPAGGGHRRGELGHAREQQ